MAKYIELTEELQLAMIAGARVIENTPKYHGTVFVKDCLSDNPSEIPYLQAARVLRDAAQRPPANVVSVRHAQWVDRYGEKYSNHVYECSACKGKGIWDGVDEHLDGWRLTAFCPYCGAMMDGGVEDA